MAVGGFRPPPGLNRVKKDCNSVPRLLNAGFILWSKQEAQRFKSTVSDFTGSSGAPLELQIVKIKVPIRYVF